MSKSNTTENDYVKFEANAVAMPSYGANLQLNLHTADPGETGHSHTNGAAYTNYAPVVVSRDATGFTICDGTNPYNANASGNAYKNADDVLFPESGSGPEVITHVSVSVVGTNVQILRKTALTASLTVNNLITPLFPAGTLVFAED
jgi:hypothetical protein